MLRQARGFRQCSMGLGQAEHGSWALPGDGRRDQRPALLYTEDPTNVAWSTCFEKRGKPTRASSSWKRKGFSRLFDPPDCKRSTNNLTWQAANQQDTTKPIRLDLSVERIYGELIRWIMSGDVPRGSKLPTEKELAARFWETKAVIRRALTLLRNDRLVYSKQGAG